MEIEKEKRKRTGKIRLNNRLSEVDGPKLFGPGASSSIMKTMPSSWVLIWIDQCRPVD